MPIIMGEDEISGRPDCKGPNKEYAQHLNWYFFMLEHTIIKI